FEARARPFMVHEQLKTGEWQDARETIGPQRGGVVGDMELRSGKYLGAAVVPQAFDKRYFTLLVMAPYSDARDAHRVRRWIRGARVETAFAGPSRIAASSQAGVDERRRPTRGCNSPV